MRASRITATLGAVALAGVLVASNPPASASAHPQHRAAHVKPAVPHHFVAPKPHKLRPHSNLPMGLHCDSTDMSL